MHIANAKVEKNKFEIQHKNLKYEQNGTERQLKLHKSAFYVQRLMHLWWKNFRNSKISVYFAAEIEINLFINI